MQDPPTAGFELLRGTPVSPLVKSVVLRHHERWNGSGYPDGKQDDGDPRDGSDRGRRRRLRRDHLERAYAAAQPAHVGVRLILDGSGTLFDPDIVERLLAARRAVPAGHRGRRSTDGRHGIVVSVPANELDRPVVRVIDGPGAPYEISLPGRPRARIAGWETHPARRRLTSQLARLRRHVRGQSVASRFKKTRHRPING